ncbi:dipeptide ABC transporter ATP-binding protein [Amycolatopsis azurea]|uniref:ABC transporter ATP-binding protein n=1 Tax=Amycolatopsis azurea DSM 43854 TaxID=1238180 RepID=M2P2B5_9PSEU|nr:ABC transporter ATP-binding protein [Amycolatopsis azurea]EMD29274.1 Dipeptide transport ATP-binding protein DppD [Amycolatopsis azurea DSM 43854]OOC01892.1 ABC transporter ATP-binding protein [Amycolatopsis azurea DSM 43854]
MVSLLEVADLVVEYHARRTPVRAVDSVSFTVDEGETVAIVGESGSGKSTTALAVLGLLPRSARVTRGRVGFAGTELTTLAPRRRRALRGREIALIPQDPGTSLNPVQRIGTQVAEALSLSGSAGRRTVRARAVELLAEAGLPDPEIQARRYPAQLSGGMRQRALIAIAIAGRPRLIVADEPTSALDVTVQRRILDHIGKLIQATGTGLVLITHDLGVAAERADRLLVMRDGAIVERGTPGEVLTDPRDPYTKALIEAAPSLADAPRRQVELTTRPGGASGDPFGAGPDTTPVRDGDLVRVEGLVKEFPLPGSGVFRAVDDVSFGVPTGRTFGLVGESGSGKSTIARLVLSLAAPTAGRVLLGGKDITRARGAELRAVRRRVQIVHQNPFASLDPRRTVEQIVADPLASYGLGTRSQRRRRAAELTDLVALPSAALRRRPGELSGGQRQRVAIARALVLNPELVVCDEPVSALDVSIQAQILDLLAAVQAELGVSYLFISHDLAVVRHFADYVGVLHRGRLVETGPTARIFADAGHTYTRELLAAIPGRH